MITLNGTTGITTPGLINTGSTTFVDLTTTGNTILGDASTDTLNVANGNLVLNSSGNLGIGTASPASKLHIQSATGTAETLIKLQTAFSNPSGNKSIVWADNSNTLGAIAVNYSAPQTSMTFGSLYNSGYNTTDLMTLTPTGLGIGTASPSARLHAVVDGAGESDIARFSRTNGADTHFLDIGVNADTNFVIFDSSGSAAGGYTFRRGGTDAMTLDASGNLSLGTTIAQQKFTLQGEQRFYNPAGDGNSNITLGRISAQVRNYGSGIANNSFASIEFCTDPSAFWYRGDIRFFTNGSDGTSNAGTERARITSGGAFGVGVTPSAWQFDGPGQTPLQTMSWALSNDVNSHYQTNNAYYGSSAWRYIASKFATRYDQDAASGTHKWFIAPSGTAGNGITWTQAMTLDSSGNLLVGTTSSAIDSSPGFKFAASSTQPNMGIVVNSTASTGLSNYHHYNTNATNNGYRFYIVNNGGIYNFSANNSNLSDRRQKKNIEPASAYLAKMMAIPVVTFDYIDQGEDDPGKTLGVIAQDVESVAPELVNNKGFGKTPEDGVPLKSIYQTDFQYALLKCIQELKAELDSVKSELATIKGAA